MNHPLGTGIAKGRGLLCLLLVSAIALPCKCVPIALNVIVGAAGDGIQELFNTQGIIGSFGEIQANYPKI